jgi:hypothetical protein
MAQKSASDFEKLSRGEKIVSDDKNLQQIFSSFYESIEQKRKNVDLKDSLNSAKTSINSLSSKLEERRRKILEMKQNALNIDKDRESETKKPEEKEEQKAHDTSKDQASAASQQKTQEQEPHVDKEQATTGEEQKATQEESTQEKVEAETEAAEPKLSMSERIKTNIGERSSAFNEKFEAKYPKAHEKTSYYFKQLKDVWAETFPDEKGKAQSKMESRRERARIAKEHEERMSEMTQEELDAYMEEIPEWKRGALVVSDAPEEEEQ